MKRVNKEAKEKFMSRIKKANDFEYETSWEGGIPVSKEKSKIRKGKTSRARGARFELKVRRDLESKGRIVDKWTNNVDLEKKELIIAKRKYNPYSKVMTIGTGFPDFISLAHIHNGMYSVIGVEVKINGVLSKIEKEKCRWYLEKKIFSEIWIAKARKNGRKIEIEYIDFGESDQKNKKIKI